MTKIKRQMQKKTQGKLYQNKRSLAAICTPMLRSKDQSAWAYIFTIFLQTPFKSLSQSSSIC